MDFCDEEKGLLRSFASSMPACRERELAGIDAEWVLGSARDSAAGSISECLERRLECDVPWKLASDLSEECREAGTDGTSV